MRRAHGPHLSPSWRTVYELTTLSDEEFAERHGRVCEICMRPEDPGGRGCYHTARDILAAYEVDEGELAGVEPRPARLNGADWPR